MAINRTTRFVDVFSRHFTPLLKSWFRETAGSKYSRKKSSLSSNSKTRRNNIILMGSPGAGKTTFGHMVASRLGMTHIDVDNDLLEKVWGMSVAQKLADLGSEEFLKAEGNVLCELEVYNSVVSLSGSNPMHDQAMVHVQSLGIVIYLDVDDVDILGRLERMKVNRIVGQNEGTHMADILSFRKQFYEGSYDIRILCERQESPKSIVNKVVTAVHSLTRRDGYISTRQQANVNHAGLTFSDVVLQGLASDGGLYVPQQEIPVLEKGEWQRLVQCSYQQRALRMLEKWISPHDLHPRDLSHMINKAYSAQTFQHPAIAPLYQLDQNCFILELFHGPTASFKDLALQLTPYFFGKAIDDRHDGGSNSPSYSILVATSGDTGSAVLEGFKNLEDVPLIVLYPDDGVSEIQKRQMTVTTAPNVHIAGVRSDFDFCQTTIKNIFKDAKFNDTLMESFNVKLSAANSINWGRLLPQVVYHASAYLDLVRMGTISLGEPVDVCIPTGNFGNILAAYYAKRMGIPYDKLICASNENNVLTQFLQTGFYDMRSRPLHSTISPSIDILKSSNLERFIYHVTEGDAKMVTSMFGALDQQGAFQVPDDLKKQLSSLVLSDWTTKQQCLGTIKDVYTRHNYLLDPHTAVAMGVARRCLHPSKPMIVAATAHYNKFARDVLSGIGTTNCTTDNVASLLETSKGLGARPAMHRQLCAVVSKSIIHKDVCDANMNAIKTHILKLLSKNYSLKV